MHRGHVRLPYPVSTPGESRARRGQRRRGRHVHRRRHPHLLHSADSGGSGLLLLGLLRRRDARRGGGAELLLGARHPLAHLRRRRGLIHSTPRPDHVWRQSAGAPHRSVVGNRTRRASADRHHVRRYRHWARSTHRHRHPASIRTHHPLLLHPHHGHPLLLRVLHLHVVEVLLLLLLLLLHANGHSLLVLHNMLRRHRSPHMLLVLRKLGHARWKLMFWKHSGTSGSHLRTSWDRGSLHVDHSLRSGMLLYVRCLRLLLISSSSTSLLLHRPLFLVAVLSDNGCVLPLLLPQLIQDLLDIGSASGHSLEFLLIHVADFAAILLDRAVFGVK